MKATRHKNPILATRNAPAPADALIMRGFEVAQNSINKDDRTVAVCFSSEQPVKRRNIWGETFFEVLSHAPGAVDLSRLQSGATVLFNHDLNAYIGTVKSATIDTDKKGRAVLQFNATGRGAEIFEDIQSGALRYLSVGYEIDETTRTESDRDTITATRWTPFEISVVTVPADTNAAIGRKISPLSSTTENANQNTRNIMNRDQLIALLKTRGITVPADISDADLNATLARSLQSPEEAGKSLRESNAAIRKIADQYTATVPNARDLALNAIAEGHTADQFQRTLLDALHKAKCESIKERGTRQ